MQALSRGSASPTELAALSDLSRSDASTLATLWPSIPDETREIAVRRLAELAEESVQLTFNRVFRIALGDSVATVCQLAIGALWEDEGSDLVERFIVLAASDPSPDVRAAAILGLDRACEAAAGDELDEAVADQLRDDIYRYASDSDEQVIVRRRALEMLAIFGGTPELTELIEDAFDSEDSAVRGSALYAMGRSLDRRWISTVINEFASDDGELRYEAARASGRLGHPDALPGLAELLRDDDAEVRAAAIDAIGKIGGTGGVRILRNLLRTDEDVDREAVEEALDEALLSVELGRG